MPEIVSDSLCSCQVGYVCVCACVCGVCVYVCVVCVCVHVCVCQVMINHFAMITLYVITTP